MYEVTPFQFGPLKAEPFEDDVRSEEESTCCCSNGNGVATSYRKCPLCNGSSSKPTIQRIDLIKKNGCAFVLQNLLSPTECKQIIEQAEGFGFESVALEMRVTDRVAFMGKDLAALLFHRASPFLVDIEVRRRGREVVPEGIRFDAKSGIWKPTILNPCFRVCKYHPGGFFLPHADAGFEYHKEYLSLMTFMLYLNDGFEGAPTNFFTGEQIHYVEPDPSKVICAVTPVCGSCLVFNHALTHDGGTLIMGTKYILRTEVMYKYLGLK